MGKTINAPDSNLMILFGFDEDGDMNALYIYGPFKKPKFKMEKAYAQIKDEMVEALGGKRKRGIVS